MTMAYLLTGCHPGRFKMKKQRAEKVADQRRAYYWGRVRTYCERYSNFNWPSTELILNLVYTHALLSDSLKVYSEFDLSASAMNILMILHLGEGKVYKQQELSSLLLVSRANVTKVIDSMEKRGLVTRSTSHEDRRARFIKLTGAGKTLANRIIPVQNERSVRVTAGLSTYEISTLNKLLAKFSMKIIENGKTK
jgi:MarR family transcriptional regulator, 2-MHQ and catechol-resistance regulon repressor